MDEMKAYRDSINFTAENMRLRVPQSAYYNLNLF